MRFFMGGWTIAVAVVLIVSGCIKPATEPGIGGHVARGKEKRSLENDIRQLAQLMVTYQTEFGKPPRSWEEFKPYIQRDAQRIVREIEEKQFEILWGAPMNSSTIIAYEVEPDIRNSHVVARGDGSVVTMTTTDLQTALQNQERRGEPQPRPRLKRE